MTIFLRVVAAIIAVLVPLQAQLLTAPSLGVVFDPASRELRRISGVPGAAAAGDTVGIGETLTSAWVDSRSRLAIGISKDGELVLGRWGTSSSALRLPGRPGPPLDAALAGGSAVVAWRDGVQVWSNLKAEPLLVSDFPAVDLGGPPASVALSSDGSRAAVLLESGDVVQIAEGRVRPMGIQAVAVAYRPGTSQIVALNADGRLWLLSGEETTVLAESEAGDALLAVLEDRVVTADGKTGQMAVVSFTGVELVNLRCECLPRSAQRLDAAGLLYVPDAESGGWLLDLNASPNTIQPLRNLPAMEVR